MLAVFVIVYLAFTIAAGLWASRKISSSSDFALAGRSLPMYLSASAFFATWFGAETVLGASSEFVQHGFLGVIEDPFGASLCLFLVGAIFAGPLYRLNMLSLGDLFRDRFGRHAEIIASSIMIISFFGWTAAQFIAFGLVFHFVAGVSVSAGIFIGVIAVIAYTTFGGMWAVSLTDFIQTIVIIAGLLIVVFQLASISPDLPVLTQKLPDGFLTFVPTEDAGWFEYIAAWVTIGLGSIPSQDVFQRINSTRSERAARRSAFIGGFMYLTIAFIPLVIGLMAVVLEPGLLAGDDTQKFLPFVIMKYSPLWVQVMFFGALISAILSSASAGVLAPSTILAENIFKNFWPSKNDRKFLLTLRLSVVIIALLCYCVTFFRSNIFELVGESSSLTLVSLFVPMMAALFMKDVGTSTVFISMISGLSAWLVYLTIDNEFPAILAGLFASTGAFLLSHIIGKIRPDKNQLSSS